MWLILAALATAASFDVSVSSVNVEDRGSGTFTVEFNGAKTEVPKTESIELTGTTTSNTVIASISSGSTVLFTLRDLHMTLSSGSAISITGAAQIAISGSNSITANASSILCTGSLKLTGADGSSLEAVSLSASSGAIQGEAIEMDRVNIKAEEKNPAGQFGAIAVSSSLTISNSDVIAFGGNQGAVIGGFFERENVRITIKDSRVNATVHETEYASGAVIGSGDQAGHITIDITRSTIQADSKTQNTGACIGSGRNGAFVDITINGSTIGGIQNGRTWQDVGSVIGSGREASHVKIVLTNTVVVGSTDGGFLPGSIVGSGVYSNDVYVSAHNCQFDVHGGDMTVCALIGSSMSCTGLTLIMNECTVKGVLDNEATGAIVGAGFENTNATITLTKCTIVGTVGSEFTGSAVGTGWGNKNAVIEMEDVAINVTVGDGCKGTGIGAGSTTIGLDFTARNCNFTAKLGRGSYGAAIGSGFKADNLTLDVTNCQLEAVMGDNSTGAAIGSGFYKSYDWGSMTFTNSKIYAYASQADCEVGAAAIGGGASTEFIKSTIYMYGQRIVFDSCNVTAIGGSGSLFAGAGIGFGAYLSTETPWESELDVIIRNSNVIVQGGVSAVGGREGAAIGGSGNYEEVIKQILIEKSNITATAGWHDRDVTVFGIRSDKGLGTLTITDSRIFSTSHGHSFNLQNVVFNNGSLEMHSGSSAFVSVNMEPVGKPILILNEVRYPVVPHDFVLRNQDTNFEYQSEGAMSERTFTSLFSLDNEGVINVHVNGVNGEKYLIVDSGHSNFYVESGKITEFSECVCELPSDDSNKKLVIIVVSVCIPVALCIGLLIGCLCRKQWHQNKGYTRAEI